MEQYQISGPLSISNEYVASAPGSLPMRQAGCAPGAEPSLSESQADEYRRFSEGTYKAAWDSIERQRAERFVLASTGFIDSTQSSTRYSGMSKQAASELFWTSFNSNKDYEKWQNRKAARENPQQFLYAHSNLLRSHSKRSIYRLSQFPSGELTGSLVTLGREGKHIPSVRKGPVETHTLSNRGKTNIRRAIECALNDITNFCTLTFDPNLSQLNEDGTVNHYWAKAQLHRFLDALTKICIRRGQKQFKYLWVAEIQLEKTNNIHFHILWNQYFPIAKLTELWQQANNSVDIKHLKNVHHAKRYVMKYISKQEKTSIKGNRYAISSGLRVQMQAVTYSIEEKSARREATSLIGAITSDIQSVGGYVNEWGFSIPMPERERRIPGKTYPGISRQISLSLLDLLLGELPF